VFKYIIQLIRSFIPLIFTCPFLFGLSACSSNSNPVIYYNNFHFTEVKNYSFYTSGSTFFDSQSLNYAQRNRVELAIEKSLNAQEFTYSELKQADIIVTYHLVRKNKKDYQAYNKAIRFCAHCLKANAWKKGNDDWQVYPGGLIIDLINPKNNRSVWRSIYPLNYDVKDNSKELNEKIMEAVNVMLSQYPRE